MDAVNVIQRLIIIMVVISEAVRKSHYGTTEEEVNTAMSDHFKQAPGRRGGGGYATKRPRDV